jgi:hypothetical protein
MSLSEPILSERQGYWATHPYHRLNVEDYIEEFCGWTALTELFELVYDEKQKAFFITMFLTGGRVTEVLLLKKNNFTVLPEEGIIKVTDMRLLKRYEKLDGYVDAEGNNRWHTDKITAFRDTFTIDRREPFTKILEHYLKQVNDSKLANDPKKASDVYLFPSPYSHSRKYKKKYLHSQKVDWYVPDANGEIPYTMQWAYMIIREVNDCASEELKHKLGLLRPFRDKKGNTIADEIHLFLHWFRSQRASQLARDYKLDVVELIDYFNWKDIETAVMYAKKGGSGLTEKMRKAKVRYI